MQHDELARSALILYGTETGNAQDIAYELDQCLQRLRFATTNHELDNVRLSDLQQHDLVVFALSTTGQGDFPSNARKFWLSLLRKKLTATSLSLVTYGLVGLCDSSYPKFNLAARKLNKRLQQLGAAPFLYSCEADEQGEEGTEGIFLSWLSVFQEKVLARFPLPQGYQPIPKDQSLPRSWLLGLAPVQDGKNGEGFEAASAKSYGIDPKIEFTVTLEQNERVTPTDHWQDVRLLKFRAASPVNYMPGDALAIRPQNSDEDVDQLIKMLHWEDMTQQKVVVKNMTSIPQRNALFDSALAHQKDFTLRQLLAEYLDINAIPRRSFFAKIAQFTEDETQKERALEFTDPQYLDEYFDYATRPRRSILEVLQEFHTVKIPWQEAINVFPILRPRQFSIASGGYLKDMGHNFDLLVAVVKYRTVIKRIREGVCTKFLARLAIGTNVKVKLHTEGRFHQDATALSRPHLLLGGGTGIAPLRSIVYEQAALQNPKAESVLVFGCRSSKADYFFRDEWLQMECQEASFLRVVTAFSRDQKDKVYIQDRLRQNAELVRSLLQKPDSTIIVCGSSGAMPKAVREALIDVIAAGNPSSELAEDELVRFEKESRYKQETW